MYGKSLGHRCSIPTLVWVKHLRPCKLHLWVILSTWIISCGGRVTYPKLTSKNTWLGLYQKSKQLHVFTFPVEFDPQESAVSGGSRWRHFSLIGSFLHIPTRYVAFFQVLQTTQLRSSACFRNSSLTPKPWKQRRKRTESFLAGTFLVDWFRGSMKCPLNILKLIQWHWHIGVSWKWSWTTALGYSI